MRALVVGATGVLGRQVLPRLIERGHQVRAVVRRPDEAERLRRLGAEATLGDILDAASLIKPAEGCDAVFHLATAIPHPGGAQNWTLNDEIRREGTRNLLAAAEHAGARRYVQESITLLYGDQDGQIVDETTPIRPVPLIQSAADMESYVRATPLEWCILRAGSLYGPGTGREADWLQSAKDGTLRLPGQGEALALAQAAGIKMAATPASTSRVECCPGRERSGRWGTRRSASALRPQRQSMSATLPTPPGHGSRRKDGPARCAIR